MLIFSGHANASGHVRREVDLAIGQGMIILPVRVEDVPPKGAMKFALSNRHWLDAFTPPVERQLELLAQSVKKHLGHDPEPPPGDEPPITDAIPETSRPPWVWMSVVAGMLMLGLLAAWLGSMFQAKAPDSVIAREKAPSETSLEAAEGDTNGLPTRAAASSARLPVDERPISSTAKTVEAPTGRAVDKPGVSTEGAWTLLFNGKNLSGWTFPLGSHSDWSVEGGVLTSSAQGESALIATSRRDFADFHLRVEVQALNERGKVIGFRSSFDPQKNPNQFRSYNFNTGGLKVGDNTVARLPSYSFKRKSFVRDAKYLTKENLHELTPPTLAPLKQQAWYKVEIIAVGHTFPMLVDDREVSAFQDTQSRLRAGRITFNPFGGLRIRKIEIKEL